MLLDAEDFVLMNLIDVGVIKRNIAGEDMGVIKTEQDNFYLYFERNKYENIFNNASFNYICNINIKDILNTNIISLSMNEYVMMSVYDSIKTFLDFNMPEIIIPINTFNMQGQSYQIHLYKEMTNPMINYFTIDEYSYMHQSMVQRCKIKLSDEEFYNILDIMYFIFLVDIEDYITDIENKFYNFD